MRLSQKAHEIAVFVAIALLGGAAGSFAFAPAGSCLFLFAGLVAFFRVVTEARTVLLSVSLGWLWGMAYFLPGVSWTFHSMHSVAGMPALICGVAVLFLAAALAIAPALAAFCGQKLPVGPAVRMAVVLPVLWAVSEWLRGTVFGFGWLSAGYCLGSTILSSWAPVAGVYGVSLVAAILVGSALAAFSQRTGILTRALPLMVFGAAAIASWHLESVSWSAAGSRLEVRLVQPDLPVALRFTMDEQAGRLERVRSMSLRSPSGRSPELIVWPESVYAGLLSRMPVEMAMVPVEVAGKTGAEVLFNAFSQKGKDEFANSLWLAVPGVDGIDPVYDKRHLVPMGEYVLPGLRWFIDMMGIPMHDQSAGSRPVAPLSVAGVPAALGICYENMFGEEWRDWWKLDGEPAGPEILVITANLGWFSPFFTHQFTQMSVMRALEFSRPVLQAVNNSGSAYITASGAIERMASPGAMTLDASVRTAVGRPTPFARFGHLPFLTFSLISVLAAWLAALRGKVRQADAEAG